MGKFSVSTWWEMTEDGDAIEVLSRGWLPLVVLRKVSPEGKITVYADVISHVQPEAEAGR